MTGESLPVPTIVQRLLTSVLPLIAVTAAAVILLLPVTAQANGRVTKFVRQEAGPYEIALGMIPDSPVVGSLHLTMNVLDLSSQTPVLDATVAVTGRGPEAEVAEIGPLTAFNNPTNPAFYGINTEVDRVGIWTFTVAVSGDRGDASTDFLIKVETPNPISKVLTWVTVMVFVALVGFGLYPFLRDRMRRRRT